MASVFVRRSPAPPKVWDMLMEYWQVPASLAVAWWQALGQSHHPRALAVREAVLLFDAAPVAEAYHLVYGVCAPQAVMEILEALVDEGQLPRSQATTIEEAVLCYVHWWTKASCLGARQRRSRRQCCATSTRKGSGGKQGGTQADATGRGIGLSPRTALASVGTVVLVFSKG